MLSKEALHQLLMSMPADGGWVRGDGPYRDTFMAILDEGTPFIEENLMPEDDNIHVDWLVRLTPEGIAQTSQSPEDGS